jgi:hypothetical protein
MIAALRRQHAIPAALRAEWLSPDTESLLWLPDIAAGAASLSAVGDDTCLRQIAVAYTTCRITLT